MDRPAPGQPTEPARLPTPLLSLDGITKAFFGNPVLRGISLEVRPGTVVGLVGENGAGKSTLMNILGGNLRPDAGRLTWRGHPYRPASPRDAESAGIAFVHQELNLFPNLAVAENLFLSRLPTRGPLIASRTTTSLARQALDRVGLRLPPDTPVERLSAGERQLVEIARTLVTEPRLVILDEPTTSLGAHESARLFALIDQLRRSGVSFIYISHALGDVLRLADEILVLRDGERVGHGPATHFDVNRLVSLMVGRQLTRLYPERQDAPGREVRLEATALTRPGVVRDVSFRLHRGEVLGLFGLLGAGRTELARLLFGLETGASGRIALDGQGLTGPPRHRVHLGLALLTEDRRADGLCPEASVADNIALATLPARSRPPLGWLDLDGLRSAIARIREAVRLQPRLRDDQPVRTLSGGNQQKVVLARWLLANPRVLILDEPTRGIDVGARFEIYQLLLDLADRGTGILLISSELEELTGLADRLLVMSRGRLTGEFRRADFDRERILQAALQAF